MIKAALKDWNNRKNFISARLVELDIPKYTMPGLIDHVLLGHSTGEFLWLLLTGAPWQTVIAKADAYNRMNLIDYQRFLYNHVPSSCWGTEKEVLNWQKAGGFAGMCGLTEEQVLQPISTGKVVEIPT